ncbi:hypothetical protein LOAG_11513 [Loa loa]|uniref:Uncharacterized protein n=1 Tax=Loa loa TaxID=7209 RepID=A0A1S0TMX3_LOALO|nr:hypothetical protein LOAG_11513 [Loa loa]EFO16990.1 hypothetical protein LOAG_11513 [Loa loa]
MSTSEGLLVLTGNITHRQQRISSSTELAITTNLSSSSEPLPSSTPATTVTTRPDPVTFQKPFGNFIDVIVAAFTVSSNFVNFRKWLVANILYKT